jgi:hypothetical protein
MNSHIRLASVLWIVTGLALASWSAWGFITEGHSRSAVLSDFIVLAFAALAIIAGLTFGKKTIGRILISITSSLSLIYALAWLFFGGVEDAGSYAPSISVMVIFSIYALYVVVAKTYAT